MAPKSKTESRVHYAPEPARGDITSVNTRLTHAEMTSRGLSLDYDCEAHAIWTAIQLLAVCWSVKTPAVSTVDEWCSQAAASATSTDSQLPHPQHTHIPLNGPMSRTTHVSRYQKGKTDLDFTEARDSEWQWHQLGHMQVCTLLQTDNHSST